MAQCAVRRRDKSLSAPLIVALKEASCDMPALPSILVYGQDYKLLRTRRWVLEQAGYRVLTATALVEAERFAATEAIGLLLLCHSLSVEDCERALNSVSTIRPEMKRLLMTADTPLCPLGPNDRVLSAFDGPKALVAAVHELVSGYVNESRSSLLPSNEPPSGAL